MKELIPLLALCACVTASAQWVQISKDGPNETGFERKETVYMEERPYVSQTAEDRIVYPRVRTLLKNGMIKIDEKGKMLEWHEEIVGYAISCRRQWIQLISHEMLEGGKRVQYDTFSNRFFTDTSEPIIQFLWDNSCSKR